MSVNTRRNADPSGLLVLTSGAERTAFAKAPAVKSERWQAMSVNTRRNADPSGLLMLTNGVERTAFAKAPAVKSETLAGDGGGAPSQTR
jgi:hypothetical protein